MNGTRSPRPTSPSVTSPSNPHENPKAPLGNCPSPNWQAISSVSISLTDDLDLAFVHQIGQPRDISLARPVQRHQQVAVVEPDAPVQIPGMVAQFQPGPLVVAWPQPQPALLGQPHHHGAVVFQQQHGAVEDS